MIRWPLAEHLKQLQAVDWSGSTLQMEDSLLQVRTSDIGIRGTELKSRSDAR